MKLIKVLIGTVAAIFSLQSIATWAANSEGKKISITIPARTGTTGGSEGSPTCHTCG